MKPRSFHKTKRTITGVNGQPAEWEESWPGIPQATNVVSVSVSMN